MNAAQAIFYLLSNNNHVTDIVSNRIYPLYSPQAFEAPFITYQLISNSPSNTKTGVSITDSLTYQINCVGGDHDTTYALKEAVRIALDYQYVEGVQHISFQGERGMWDESSQLQGSTAFAQDYLIREIRANITTPVRIITQAAGYIVTQQGQFLITQQ